MKQNNPTELLAFPKFPIWGENGPTDPISLAVFSIIPDGASTRFFWARYCQSMNFVAATFLLYNTEEQAFWMMCAPWAQLGFRMHLSEPL